MERRKRKSVKKDYMITMRCNRAEKKIIDDEIKRRNSKGVRDCVMDGVKEAKKESQRKVDKDSREIEQLFIVSDIIAKMKEFANVDEEFEKDSKNAEFRKYIEEAAEKLCDTVN